MDDYRDPSAIAKLVGLSEEAFPEWGLAIVGYMDPDGETRFESMAYGEPTVVGVLGVLEMIKRELLDFAYEDTDE